MSCAEATGCECGNNCRDEFFDGLGKISIQYGEAGCEAPTPLCDVPVEAREARYTVRVDKREKPYVVTVTRNGIQVYKGSNRLSVEKTLYG